MSNTEKEIIFALEFCRSSIEHREERDPEEAQKQLDKAQNLATIVLEKHRKATTDYWAEFHEFAAWSTIPSKKE